MESQQTTLPKLCHSLYIYTYYNFLRLLPFTFSSFLSLFFVSPLFYLSELKYRMAQPNQPDLGSGRRASVLGFLNIVLLIKWAGIAGTRVNRRKLCFGNLRNQVAEVDFSFSSANEATRRTAQRLMRLQCPTRHPINLAGCRLRQTSKII